VQEQFSESASAVLSDCLGAGSPSLQGRVGTLAETLGCRMVERKIAGGYQLSPTSLTRGGCVSTLRALLALASGSFLRLEVVIVGLDEGLNVLSHREKSKPLLLVQGYGESAHPVDGQSALLADLHSGLGVAGLSKALVFGSQAVNLGLLIIGHLDTSKGAQVVGRIIRDTLAGRQRMAATDASPMSIGAFCA